MLAGAGLGDQPRLAHPPGEQRLAEHLVGLVGAAVEQVLALQIDRPCRAEVAAAGQRRRPAGIIGEQVVELGLEGRDPPARRGRPPRAARAPASGSRARRRRHRRRSGRSGACAHPRARQPQRLEKGGDLLADPCARAPPRPPSRRRAHRRRAARPRGHWPGRARRRAARRRARGRPRDRDQSKARPVPPLRRCRTAVGRRRAGAPAPRAPTAPAAQISVSAGSSRAQAADIGGVLVAVELDRVRGRARRRLRRRRHQLLVAEHADRPRMAAPATPPPGRAVTARGVPGTMTSPA